VATLVYADPEEAARWLRDSFGFTARLRWGAGDRLAIELDLGGAALFVRGPKAAGPADPVARRPPSADRWSHSLMVCVGDVDAHHDRAVERGVTIVRAIETYPIGERQYSALGLDGHRWTFTQSVADVAPEAWGAVVADPA
jgi:uncharacterized glyoxalase superfamily protein PhnB